MTDLKKMSDEELLTTFDSCYNCKVPKEECARECKIKTELLRRLSEGQKAIKAMEKVTKIYEEYWTHDVIGEVEDLIDDYQKGAGNE